MLLVIFFGDCSRINYSTVHNGVGVQKYCIEWLGIAIVLVFAACKGTPHPSNVHLFTVRGQVVQVPVADKPGSQFMIHHEAVPGFIDQTGAVVGMESMTMYFPTATGLSLDSLVPGDKIQFVLSVDWPDNQVEIIKITKLPDDVMLNFGEKTSSSDSSAHN